MCTNSRAQGYTLGWGMFGPRGADASGFALGSFDTVRRVRPAQVCGHQTFPRTPTLGVGPEGAVPGSSPVRSAGSRGRPPKTTTSNCIRRPNPRRRTASDRPNPRRRTASDRPNPRRRTASDRPNPRRRTASDRPKPLRLSHSLRLCVENRPAHSGSQELPEHPTSHPAVNRQTQQLRSRPLRHRQRAGPHPIPGKLTGQRRVVDLRLHASRC